MKKLILFKLAIVSLSLLISSCKSAYHNVYANAPICLAYSSEKGVIKDQSQIATIVIPNDYGLVIDSITIISTNGKLNKELRYANDRNFKSARIIDITPGKHILEVTFSKISSPSSMGGLGSFNTKKPIIETFYFEPGEIYSLELKILDIASKLMTFKKADMSGSNQLTIKPLPDKYKQVIIDSRNKLSFE